MTSYPVTTDKNTHAFIFIGGITYDAYIVLNVIDKKTLPFFGWMKRGLKNPLLESR